jgi:preprotein translocase subunit SecD
MPRSLTWKLIFYVAISLFAILLLVPTVTTQLLRGWSKILPSEKVRLGLDLQGGMYLLLEVEVQKAVESYLEQIRSSLQDGLRERAVPVTKLETTKAGQIVLGFSGSKGDVDRLLSEQQFSMVRELSAAALSGGIWRVVLVPDTKELEQIRKNAVDQALEIMRNRIDDLWIHPLWIWIRSGKGVCRHIERRNFGQHFYRRLCDKGGL